MTFECSNGPDGHQSEYQPRVTLLNFIDPFETGEFQRDISPSRSSITGIRSLWSLLVEIAKSQQDEIDEE
jgi:hypothetical protein